MMRLFLATAFCVALFANCAIAQMQTETPRLRLKRPSEKAIAHGHKVAEMVFADLKAGETQKIAEWISTNIGYNWDASRRVQKTNEFKSQLDIVLISPPASAYGKLDGYDLIDESSLQGSDRYFRLVFLTYHEGAPMVWEFRFYVKPGGETALNYIAWNPQNPFEFMATPDMLLPRWSD